MFLKYLDREVSRVIRVLIADDSAFMRKVLSDLFRRQSDFEVVDTAKNGKEAVDKAKNLKLDLITMDVNMPVMDGLSALAVIMDECPTPVVVFSSLTQEGTEATIKALSLGAVDFLSKAGGSVSKIDTIEDDILLKCRNAAKAVPRRIGTSGASSRIKETEFQKRPAEPVMHRVEMPQRTGWKPQQAVQPAPKESPKGRFAKRENPLLQRKKNVPVPPASARPVAVGDFRAESKKLVVIGTSTGGPQALQNVITRLPGNLPCGVVVVQHMPAGFTKSLANRLNAISAVSVKEAENDELIEPGHVYIAPGDYHLRIESDLSKRKIVLSQDPPVGSHRPAVNVMYDSAAQFGKDLVAVIMTGMGCDGCEGMKKIKAHGGYSIAQNEETSVIYGMPKAVVEAGLADEIQPVQDIALAIVEAVKK